MYCLWGLFFFLITRAGSALASGRAMKEASSSERPALLVLPGFRLPARIGCCSASRMFASIDFTLRGCLSTLLGLRFGADSSVDFDRVRGRRWFRLAGASSSIRKFRSIVELLWRRSRLFFGGLTPRCSPLPDSDETVLLHIGLLCVFSSC